MGFVELKFAKICRGKPFATIVESDGCELTTGRAGPRDKSCESAGFPRQTSASLTRNYETRNGALWQGKESWRAVGIRQFFGCSCSLGSLKVVSKPWNNGWWKPPEEQDGETETQNGATALDVSAPAQPNENGRAGPGVPNGEVRQQQRWLAGLKGNFRERGGKYRGH